MEGAHQQLRTKAKTRFLRYVRKTRGCWIWKGCVNDLGYGWFHIAGASKMTAHRLMWQITHGEPPHGRLFHTCANRLCVRPDHMVVMPSLSGEANGNHTLTEEQVEAIRTSNLKQVQLAHMYGISQPQISRIISHTNWK